jgi:hypothetical protein
MLACCWINSQLAARPLDALPPPQLQPCRLSSPRRLPAFVKCDGEEAAVRELETLQARYRELAKDAREAVWRGDAPTAAPAHDPELVVSRDVLKKAREARQASVAAALRVQSLPPISDVVATQVRARLFHYC